MEDKFLQFQQSEDGEEEILLYGPIRKQSLIEKLWEVELEDGRTDALTFEERLAKVEANHITVRINSYGGSVSEGLAIYNALKSCGKEITTVCDGFACSIASVIFCAGDKRIMPSTALMMIHNAWMEGGEGDANYFRKVAEDLDKVNQPSVNAYTAVSNLSEEEIKKLMDDETWITADKALEWGFATSVSKEEAQQELQHTQILHLVKQNEKLLERLGSVEQQLKEATREPANSWSHFFN